MGAGENNSVTVSGFFLHRMNPSEIVDLAEKFVVQYYSVMRKCPSFLHRFYKDDSAMIREKSTVFGQKSIHENIMTMNFQESRVGILSLDALRAKDNSVLIQVAGEMSLHGDAFRRFMQSFVLCEQAPCDFYVLNDIFRYQDKVYGDVHLGEPVGAQKETVIHDPIIEFKPDTPVVGATPNGEPEISVSSWNNDLHSEMTYTRDEHPLEDIHGREPDPIVIDEQSTHTSHGAPSPQILPATEDSVQLPAAPSQPCSWAQMASKQPKPGTVGLQVSKSNRVSSLTVSNQNFEEQPKGPRQSSMGNQNPMTQRYRGVGGRQQTMDGRSATGDNYFAQDARSSGSGPMRGGFSRGGGPTGMSTRGPSRGARGGMGVRGGSFPRRG